MFRVPVAAMFLFSIVFLNAEAAEHEIKHEYMIQEVPDATIYHEQGQGPDSQPGPGMPVPKHIPLHEKLKQDSLSRSKEKKGLVIIPLSKPGDEGEGVHTPEGKKGGLPVPAPDEGDNIQDNPDR